MSQENITTESKPVADQNVSERVCFSVDGKSQETPEQLIVRGEGSGKPSICQKL